MKYLLIIMLYGPQYSPPPPPSAIPYESAASCARDAKMLNAGHKRLMDKNGLPISRIAYCVKA